MHEACVVDTLLELFRGTSRAPFFSRNASLAARKRWLRQAGCGSAAKVLLGGFVGKSLRPKTLAEVQRRECGTPQCFHILRYAAVFPHPLAPALCGRQWPLWGVVSPVVSACRKAFATRMPQRERRRYGARDMRLNFSAIGQWQVPLGTQVSGAPDSVPRRAYSPRTRAPRSTAR